MDKITSIKCSARDSDRCSVRVGRKVVARLSSEAVNRLGLREGAAWDHEAQRMASEAQAKETALQEAQKLLKRKPLGTAELRDRLYQKRLPGGAIHAAVAEMERRGLLDDEAYAKLVVENELSKKATGRKKLADILYRKGLPQEVIARAVTEAMAKRDSVSDARELARRKWTLSSFARLDAQARKRRLWNLLARRGFDPDTIETALKEVVAEDD